MSRSARDPGVVAEIFARTAEEAAAESTGGSEPVDDEIRRVREALLAARARRRRMLRALLPLPAGSGAWLRDRLDRTRYQVAAAGSAYVGSLSDVVASVLVATAILGGAVGVGPFGPDASFAATAGHAELIRAEAGTVRADPPVGVSSNTASDRRIAIDASLSPSDGGPAPAIRAKASAGAGRTNRRIEVGDEVSVWHGDFGIVVTDGPLLWIECHPQSIVATTFCHAYDAAFSHENDARA